MMSPVWITLASAKRTMDSPSVWACAKCVTSMVWPLRWKVSPSVKVTTGSAAWGEAGDSRSRNSLKLSTLMRARTLSCATITEPASPKFSLPPVWSKCQCVLSTKRTSPSWTAAMAARILSVSGANWSSMRKLPSSPTQTTRFPPAPSSMWIESVSGVVLISTSSIWAHAGAARQTRRKSTIGRMRNSWLGKREGAGDPACPPDSNRACARRRLSRWRGTPRG